MHIFFQFCIVILSTSFPNMAIQAPKRAQWRQSNPKLKASKQPVSAIKGALFTSCILSVGAYDITMYLPFHSLSFSSGFDAFCASGYPVMNSELAIPQVALTIKANVRAQFSFSGSEPPTFSP